MCYNFNMNPNEILLQRYSKSAKTPEVIRNAISDNELLALHRKLQNAKVWREIGTESLYDKQSGKRVTKKIYGETSEPDYGIMLRALEIAHRVRGDYQQVEVDNPKDVQKIYNIFYNPKVKEEVKRFDEMLKVKIYEESNKKMGGEISNGIVKSGISARASKGNTNINR